MGLFSAEIKTMDDLYVHTLQDIYYAEKQIVKALPDMIAKATDRELKAGFQKHLQETENQVVRLEQVFKLHNLTPKGVNCPAIDGIIEEANDMRAAAVIMALPKRVPGGAMFGQTIKTVLAERPCRVIIESRPA